MGYQVLGGAGTGGGGTPPTVSYGPTVGPGNSNDNQVSAIARTALSLSSIAFSQTLNILTALTFPALAFVRNALSMTTTLTLSLVSVFENALTVTTTLSLSLVAAVINALNVRTSLTFPALAMTNNAQSIQAKLTGTALGAPFWQSEQHNQANNAAVAAGGTMTVIVTAPTGIGDGDLLLAFVGGNSATTLPSLTPPAGWTTSVSTSLTIAGGAAAPLITTCYFKIASGESGNYTFTFTNNGAASEKGSINAEIHRINGNDQTASVINATSSATLLATALNTNPVAPDVTTTVVNCMVFSYLYHSHLAILQTHTEPAGFDERTDFNGGTTPNLMGACSADKVFATAAAVGTMTYTCTETVATDAIIQRVAIAPGQIVLL